MSNQDQNPSQLQPGPEAPGGSAESTKPVTTPPTPPAATDTEKAPAGAGKTLLIPGGSTGRTCSKCGHVNRPGILVCEKCGTLMINEEKAVGTKQFEAEKVVTDALRNVTAAETAEMAGLAVSTAGSTQFTENMVLRLEIEGAPTPILLHPKLETSIGRRDPATGTMPDVDLSAYAGYRLGVSRKHAIIRLKEEQLELYDLGSSNGTSVNGERLTAHQPHVLRDGDEVVLGKMIVRVLFQIRNRRK